ncbi:MAG: Fe2+-dependent dioxygenase [Alphaproteobacteria bacterium]|nr:Fe2+-dependent dioxygenase [Alphaproteobacteria bacterium]
MLVRVPGLLTPDEVARAVAILRSADWVDGKVTAGAQSAQAKTNLQVPENSRQAKEAGALVLRGLGRSPVFNAAALPLRVFPPLFNRYDAGMRFGDHVDNAIRFGAGARIRTDVSTTVFLSPPEDYDGGELVIQDTYGTQSVKFEAGDAVIYPSTSLHRVNEITRGSRWASFFWTQSLVRSDERRRLLFDMDTAIQRLAMELGQTHDGVVSLTAGYHNLLRMWVEM